MLRFALLCVLGLAGLSALGFTASKVIRERAGCRASCELQPAPPAALAVAEPAVVLESALPAVSAPQPAEDAALAERIRLQMATTAQSRLPPCCQKQFSSAAGVPLAQAQAPVQPQAKPIPPRTAEEKRKQTKLALLQKSAGADVQAALARNQQRASAAAAIAPATSNPKLAPRK